MSSMMDYEYHDYEDEYTPLDGSGDRRRTFKKKKTSPGPSKRTSRLPPPSETTYRGKNYGPNSYQQRGCCACLCRIFSCWTLVVVLATLWTTWLTLWLVSTYLLGPTMPSSSLGSGGGVGGGGGGADGVAQVVKIPYEVASKAGAFCLDGSAPAFYMRKGANSGLHSWILHLPDGQWCYNATNCYQRSLTPLGSSSSIPAVIPTPGLLSSDPEVNPDFHNWNVVQFHYCDGASFSSDSPMALSISDEGVIYQRGSLVLESIINYLLNTTEMGAAERIILSGTGSGGLGVFYQADHVKTLLPPTSTYHALADSAFYIDTYNRSAYMHIRIQFQRLFNLHHMLESLDSDCVQTQVLADPGSAWTCMFPEYATKYIQTPLFITNSKYDPWSIWNILSMRCHPQDCPELKPLMERFGADVSSKIQAARMADVDGVFVTSCYTSDLIGHGWDHVALEGTDVVVRDAFAAWYLRLTSEDHGEQKRSAGRERAVGATAALTTAAAAPDSALDVTVAASPASPSEYWFIDCASSMMCNTECDWSRDLFKMVADKLQAMDDFVIPVGPNAAPSQK
ncbi:pectin acetylesterase 5 [Strongylocentrotus purpuratus]|uniref:Pectin acetylesterase n=1 Tax=Strongylocentrotus purpuratus TaxID=7668 RepID=A0A7M7SU91_STRPU|nr:pectin acetylesterase 5 [Strongylocentrotus purpuratus]XP_030831825.1 pectin acetylesterase 5 [Strongylocentrotus purpuratus]